MQTIFSFRSATLIALLLLTSISANCQDHYNERAKWFIDARFGMFIHWGIYSGAEGIWKAEKLRNDNNYAEWIQYRNRIDKPEYLKLLDSFSWENIDPEKWVILAKESGMKYVVITAKHHDGFALWNSKASNYNVAEYTNPKRDILKELAVACKKHGLKLGFYYSHWLDWEHPYGWDHTKEVTGISSENYDRYWQEKVIPQMRELLTNYGPISMIWFDMWIDHSQTVVTKAQLLQLKKLIRELQPNCLVNSRLGLSVEEDSDVDIQELGDNQLGSQKKDFPWQSPATVAHSWGFNTLDSEYKSTTTLLHSLINNVSLNGNFILNIGPKANGNVPFEISQRMLEMGKWLKVNGESIYGCSAFDLPKDQHDWGKITCRKTQTGTNLYLHIFNYPLNNKLNLSGIITKPKRIYLLADKKKTPLSFTFDTVLTTINLPSTQPDPYVTVVVIEYSQKPEIFRGLVAKTRDGGYSFTSSNLFTPVKDLKIEAEQREGTIPSYVMIKENTEFNWKVYVDKPGQKTFDVSYSYQGITDKSHIVLKVANQIVIHKVSPTGKTVGEPLSNWVIDNFKSNRMGSLNFPAAGYYDIELQIVTEQNDEVKFQWLWMK
ncbi:MAG: alpha-L-fucosidase [Bacteroidetes bacterium]|nr:alpha-L-fucosidase [Bacteroidota bacterium]